MFQKGESGNRNGRPVGALNKRTQTLRLLIEGDAPDLVKKVIDKAREGDMQALKLCLERILPPVKDTPINVELPGIGKSVSSILAFSRELINVVIRGEITLSEGDILMGMIEKYGRAIDLKDLELRILNLEKAIREKK